MAVERVIIEIVGDTRQIQSTITQLEKLGKVDKANAETFKKTNEAAQKEIKQTQNSLGGLENTLGDLKNQIIGAFAIGSLIAFGKEAVQTSAKLDSITKSLEFITGGSKQAAATMEYLKKLSQKLGLEFVSTAQAFKLFSGATTQSGMSLNQTKQIFESVANATTTMGLSADDANGVFLALSQIMSKGKVSAEELRGQIGERLPGAFAIAAKSIGVTEQQLNKMLEQGQVISKDFLPKFAKQLEKDLGGGAENAANGLQAALNRITNSFTELFTAVGNGLAPFVKLVAKSFEGISAAIGGTAKIIEGAGAAMGAEQAGKVIAELEKITDINARFDASLEKKNFFQKRLTQTQTELNKLLTEQQKLESGGRFAGNGARLANIKTEIEALAGNKAMYKELVTALGNYSDELTKNDSAVASNTDKAKKQLTAYELLVKAAGDLGKQLQDLYTLKGTGAGDTPMEIKLRTLLSELDMIDTKLKQVQEGFDNAKITSGTTQGGTGKPFSNAIDTFNDPKKALELDLELRRGANEEYDKIYQQDLENWKKAQNEKIQAQQFAIEQSIQIAQQLLVLNQQFVNQQADYELQSLESQFKAKTLSEQQYQEKKKAILRKQDEAAKETAIFQATISGGVAVLKAYEQGGVAGPILAAIVGALTIAQIAAISATPLPQYAKGTDFVKLGKNKKGVDTVPALLNEGEAVIKTNENAKYPGLSKAWNEGKLDTYITRKFLLPNAEAKPIRGLESNIFAENVARSIRLNSDMGGVEFGLKKLNKTEMEAARIIVEGVSSAINNKSHRSGF